ncbi:MULTISPECIES: cupin domain-containing protein [unclassified Microbacterium]|uniref:cupin domain-containing protein n=1 Tax=unclassified Microbacterium TaxID=2609290 RepID=UPI0012FB1F17|nr:cupin domain-containing protein [Microbacterium sp. MAH-37]MVQ41354.1 cupin domain-containing protein [Microbacterium sp. MAH-37]
MSEPNDIDIDMPFHSAGETIEVLAAIPLADRALPAGSTPLSDRTMRMRRITVEPGGVIAAHPHDNRPTILFVMTGALLEFSVGNDVAVEHAAPAVVTPTATHWWRNAGDEAAVIIGADLLDPHTDAAQG